MGRARRRRVGFVLLVVAVVLAAAWASCGQHGGDATRGVDDVDTVEGADDVAAPPVEREHVESAPAGVVEEPEGPPTLVVRAVLPGGAPLAGAEVQVAAQPPVWTEPPEVVADGTTGATGELRVPLPPGAYQVRGVHTDVMLLGASVDHPADGVVTLHAGAGPRVVLTVVDGEGEPIAGAVAWERHSDAGRVAVTGTDGRADLGRVYPSNPMVRVVAQGRQPWGGYLFGTWDGRDVVEHRVVLSGSVTPVAVRVVDHDGTPVAGAVVRFPGGLTATDTDGCATLDLAGLGPQVWAKAEAPDGRAVRIVVEAAPPSGESVELRLPPPEPLAGRVLHAWSGAPVAGAAVLIRRDEGWTRVADSAADGTFVVPHAGRGELELLAFAPGLGPSGEAWDETPEPREDGTVDLRVAPTMRMSGRVVDAAGAPRGDVRVEAILYGDGPPLGVEPSGATTTADGTFTITGVPAVPRVIARATDGRGIGWSDIDLEIPPEPDGAFDVGDVVVPSGFDLDVPVRDDDGAPLPSAFVFVSWRIVSEGTPSEHRLVLDGRMDPVLGVPRDFAVADIEAPGCLHTTLRVDATTKVLVADRPCTARGRLVRADTGEPVAGVWVIAKSQDRLWTLDGNNSGMQTLADGTFELMRLRRGRYELSAREPGENGREGPKLTIRTTDLDLGAREVDLGDVLVD